MIYNLEGYFKPSWTEWSGIMEPIKYWYTSTLPAGTVIVISLHSMHVFKTRAWYTGTHIFRLDTFQFAV